MRKIFSKIIAQHQNDAKMSIIMTIFTTMSACRNNPQTERSWPIDPASAAEVTADCSILQTRSLINVFSIMPESSCSTAPANAISAVRNRAGSRAGSGNSAVTK